MYGVLMNENDHYFLALLICHDFHRAFHDLAVRTQDHLTDTILSLANFGMLDLTNLMKSIVELFDGQFVGVRLDFVEYCPHSAFFPTFLILCFLTSGKNCVSVASTMMTMSTLEQLPSQRELVKHL